MGENSLRPLALLDEEPGPCGLTCLSLLLILLDTSPGAHWVIWLDSAGLTCLPWQYFAF